MDLALALTSTLALLFGHFQVPFRFVTAWEVEFKVLGLNLNVALPLVLAMTLTLVLALTSTLALTLTHVGF